MNFQISEKRELCSKWKKEAIEVEAKLAEKQKAKIVQAVQDRFALTEKPETALTHGMYSLSSIFLLYKSQNFSIY